MQAVLPVGSFMSVHTKCHGCSVVSAMSRRRLNSAASIAIFRASCALGMPLGVSCNCGVRRTVLGVESMLQRGFVFLFFSFLLPFFSVFLVLLLHSLPPFMHSCDPIAN